MSCTSLGCCPRRAFDWQGWGAVFTLAGLGGWSQAGEGLIGLVADVQPATGPAGLGWGLQRAALGGKDSLFPQFCLPSHTRPALLSFRYLEAAAAGAPTFSSSSSSLSEPGSVEIPQG